MRAKRPNNASPLNKVLIPPLFSHPHSSSISSLSLLPFSLHMPKLRLKEIRGFVAGFCCSREKLIWSSHPPSELIAWTIQPAISLFPEKLTSIWSRASWALSSAPLQGERRKEGGREAMVRKRRGRTCGEFKVFQPDVMSCHTLLWFPVKVFRPWWGTTTASACLWVSYMRR